MTTKVKAPVCRIVTYPDLERVVIHRYEKIAIDKTHYSVRCIETLTNEDGVRCWCSMKPTREDHFKHWLLTNTHVCTPGIPCSNATLDKFILSSSPQGHYLDLTEDAIYEEMAVFTGKYNLSLDILSSEDFYNLAIKLIAFGISHYDLNAPYEKAKRSFKRLHRDKLRYTMINTAFKKHRKIISQFEDVPYVSLALDEGKTSGYSNLHFVLESPFTDLPSYPFDTIRMDGGKAPHYVASIRKGLETINRTDIKIGTVVCDGNTAQKTAFNPKWNKSLYHKPIPDIEKLVFIPCLCHRVHRSYVTCTERNPDLGEAVAKLHELADECRENYSLIGALCPAHCETRWVYDYNIVYFILNHKETIMQFKDFTTDITIEELDDLQKSLAILKKLISLFENPKTKFQTAFLHLERAINALFELDKEGNKYSKILGYSLQSYTLGSTDCGLWALAYCFTRNGRKDFRKRNLRKDKKKKSNLSYFDLNFPPDDDDENERLNIISDADEILMTEEGKDIEENEEETTESETDDFLDDDLTILDGDEDSTATDTEFINYFASAKNKLKNYWN